MNANLQAMLIQLLAAKSGIDPATLTDAGGSAGSLDPSLTLLLNFLKEKQAAADEPDEDPDPEPEPEEPPEDGGTFDPEVLSPTPASVRIRMLRAEVEQLRRRSDTLATALGACYLCWGRDAACVQCLGAGRPGWNDPDEPLFRRLVSPAIRRRRDGPHLNPEPRRPPDDDSTI
jgi:hypothetical protein